MRVVVSDTSPIVALARLDLLQLPAALFQAVVVPPSVRGELGVRAEDRHPLDVAAIPGVRFQAPAEDELLGSLRRRLDPGEAEAISLAVQLGGATLLIDERAGRRIAEDLGVDPLGHTGPSGSSQTGRAPSSGRSADRPTGTGNLLSNLAGGPARGA